MGALFYDIAFFHHEDDVSIFYRRKTMGDDKTGPSFHQCIHRLLDAGFGSRIYGTGGFVQDHDLVVCQDRPGDGQKLFLPLRYVAGFFVQLHLIAARKRLNEMMCVSRLCRFDDFFVCGIQSSVADVFHDRALEEPSVLKDHAEETA